MNWFRKIFPTEETKLLMGAADRIFEEICQGGISNIAEVYKAHPEVRDRYWKEIRGEVAALIGNGNDPEFTKRMRRKWAEQTELYVACLYYISLPEDDREVICKYGFGKDRKSQDEVYDWDMVYRTTYASLLQAIILSGWVGPPGQELLLELKDNYISSCQRFWELTLDMAYRKRDGRELTEEEKEDGKTTYLLREVCRCALSGENPEDWRTR